MNATKYYLGSYVVCIKSRSTGIGTDSYQPAFRLSAPLGPDDRVEMQAARY